MFLKKHRSWNLVVCLMLTMFLGLGSLIMPDTVIAIDETPIMELIPEDEGDYQILADPADISDNTIDKTMEAEPQSEIPNLSTDTANNEIEENTEEVTADFSELITPAMANELLGTMQAEEVDDRVYAPVVIADTTRNIVGEPVEITFSEDESWSNAITGITVKGKDLSAEQYTVSSNTITLAVGVFTGTGDYEVIVKADGYADAVVTQSIETFVEIKGDGVTTPIIFTMSQLKDMQNVPARPYSTINTWPTKKWYTAEGVRLVDLLEVAELKADAKLITVKSRDGYTMKFTKKELLDDTRYYFPGLKENHEYFGEISGSPNGAVPVDVLLALKSVDSDNFNYMNDQNSPLLIFGQRYVTEQTNHAFAKKVCEIVVSTTAPDKWPVPTAAPVSATVEAGTGVVLQSVNNDADKVYYTTNGTDPTYESPMYNWIASRWWNDRKEDLATINHPIEITQDTFIKAKTIGLGQEDSDIVTFEYKVLQSAAPVLIADSTDNMVGQAVDITFTDDADWRTAITSIEVNGTALSDEQYRITEGNINLAAALFTAAGDYAIVVKATGYSNSSVTQNMQDPSLLVAPVLNPDTSNNIVGQAIDITFTDDEAWRGAITDVTVNGASIAGQYSVTDGKITIETSVFTAIGDYAIVVKATGYSDAGVTQTIKAVSDPSDFVIENGILRGYRGAGGDVIIPNDLGITSIGDQAFANCGSSLTSISIPEGVTSIGDNAFQSCSSLRSISIPEGVTSIGGSVFWGCSSLSSVTIPSSVTSIGDSVFYECSNLSSVNIPYGVTSIGKTVFWSCSSLRSIAIPDSVTGIGDSAFYGCSSLTAITIHDNVTSIGESAFRGCSSLSSVTIPGRVTIIGNDTFNSCSTLGSVSISKGVTSIGKNAFKGCSNLISISIPDSVTSIGKSAFQSCTSLTSISIPDSVTSIGEQVFRDCSSLTEINVGSNNLNYASDGGVLFNKNKTILVCCLPGKTGEYIIPNSVENIEKNAFFNCTNLTSITIPDSITSISDHAFNGCSSLASIIIPESVTSIGNYAFGNCSSLNSIIIPESVTSIGSNTFRGCSNLTIYGYAGSYAQSYAVTGNIPFEVVALVTPALIPDSSNNKVGQAVNVIFIDDAVWRAAITTICVDGIDLAVDKYVVTEGKVTIDASVFTEAKDYVIMVKATGYQDATVIQTIIAVVKPNSVYTISIQANNVYATGTTADGINTMRVNADNTGLKYFTVNITSVESHDGDETVVFTHLRNDTQLGLNATRADFDVVDTAQAGFNVQPSDVIKAYIVDDLSNAIDENPVILQ